ncbi:hypothetical protein ACP70R_036304 [Stipagrostis hirtigluma subsp. patula]
MSTLMAPAPPAPTPPALMVPVPYSGGSGAEARGSYGPVIAMLAVVVVLAAAAVAVGRLCFGRRALGHAGGRDLEAWVERTCGPCVGAAVFVTPAPAGQGGVPAKEEEGGGSSGTVAAATQPPPEGITELGEASGSGGGS